MLDDAIDILTTKAAYCCEKARFDTPYDALIGTVVQSPSSILSVNFNTDLAK